MRCLGALLFVRVMVCVREKMICDLVGSYILIVCRWCSVFSSDTKNL